MKRIKPLALLVLASPGLALAALSEYQGSAELSYALSSIEGGDPSALSVTVTFQPLFSSAYLEGEGRVNNSNPSMSVSLGLGEPFIHTFAVSGEVVNLGRVDAQDSGEYVLKFLNSGSEAYTVQLAWSYRLLTHAAGQAASSRVQLEYWLEDYSISGYDWVLADAIEPDVAREGGELLTFTLSPGASLAFYTQVGIEGNLEVPVPAALWLLGSALFGLVGLRLKCGISRTLWV